MSDSASQSAPEPVRTAAEFLAIVQASGLVPPAKFGEVQAAVASWKTAGPMPEACQQALVAGTLLTDWHIQQLLRRCGRKHFFLDKFKLLQPLGKGGMGSVYLAEHTKLNMKRVAIKLLPKKLEAKGTYLKRFQQENWAAARLNHENIARAWDDFDEPDEDAPYHYSVMDYIEGEDLDKLVRKNGPLKAKDAAELINQAALGLHHAHGHGFVHRDIKPANLIVDTEGTLKILDFGLVQTADDDQHARALKAEDRKKLVVGTPDYISPEQAQGKPVDCRSDIYSLGCTLYFLLTGHAPFDTVKGEPGVSGGTRIARTQAHVNMPVPSLLEKRPNLPAKLVTLVERMMAKEPRDRPASADEVAGELFMMSNGEELDAFDEQEAVAAAASGGVAPRPISGEPSPALTTAPQAASLRPASGVVVAPRSAAAAAPHASSAGRSGVPPMRPAAPVRQADTPPPSSSARSTGRMPAAVPPGGGARSQPTTGGSPAAPRPPGQRSTNGTKPGAVAATGDPPEEASGGLFQIVAGLPIIGWLVVAIVLITVIATAVIWSL